MRLPGATHAKKTQVSSAISMKKISWYLKSFPGTWKTFLEPHSFLVPANVLGHNIAGMYNTGKVLHFLRKK